MVGRGIWFNPLSMILSLVIYYASYHVIRYLGGLLCTWLNMPSVKEVCGSFLNHRSSVPGPPK